MNSSIRIKLNIELKPELVTELCEIVGAPDPEQLGLYINIALHNIVMQDLGITEMPEEFFIINSDVEIIEDHTGEI